MVWTGGLTQNVQGSRYIVFRERRVFRGQGVDTHVQQCIRRVLTLGATGCFIDRKRFSEQRLGTGTLVLKAVEVCELYQACCVSGVQLSKLASGLAHILQ